MTLEVTPAHEAPETGGLAGTPDDGVVPAAMPPVLLPLSRLSFCLAWLFGLEAFLRESSERDNTHARR